MMYALVGSLFFGVVGAILGAAYVEPLMRLKALNHLRDMGPPALEYLGTKDGAEWADAEIGKEGREIVEKFLKKNYAEVIKGMENG
jgi:hypothetical protein